MKKYNFADGTLCNINFNGNIGSEINNIYLGLLYNIPTSNNLTLCVPLTSPKLKHFKTKEDFIKRNYLNTKHFGWQYIKQTDSIALLEQLKIIDKKRILNYYKNEDGKIIVLEDKEQSLIKSKITKYLKIILYKNKEKKHIIK